MQVQSCCSSTSVRGGKNSNDSFGGAWSALRIGKGPTLSPASQRCRVGSASIRSPILHSFAAYWCLHTAAVERVTNSRDPFQYLSGVSPRGMSGRDHVFDRQPDLRPFSCLETAIGIDPKLVGGKPPRRGLQ